MTDPVTGQAAKSEDVNHPVRWDGDSWAQIVEAARIQTEREHYKVTPTDLIRQGTMRRIGEILASSAEAA